MLKAEKSFRLQEEKGTKPNVHYVGKVQRQSLNTRRVYNLGAGQPAPFSFQEFRMPHYDHDKGAAREDLCRLLAACYYEPGPEFAEEKVFDSMLDAASADSSGPCGAARAGSARHSPPKDPKAFCSITRAFSSVPPTPLPSPTARSG